MKIGALSEPWQWTGQLSAWSVRADAGVVVMSAEPKELVVEVVREYIDFVNEQVGVYMSALAGFAGPNVQDRDFEDHARSIATTGRHGARALDRGWRRAVSATAGVYSGAMAGRARGVSEDRRAPGRRRAIGDAR